MTPEDKELLLKDLSARLPYRVIVRIGDDDAKAPLIEIVDVIGKDYKSEDAINGWSIDRIGIKPYLRSMSSMTDEEIRIEREIQQDCFFGRKPLIILTDFYYSRNLDVNGLIEKGLALEAPDDMYNV